MGRFGIGCLPSVFDLHPTGCGFDPRQQLMPNFRDEIFLLADSLLVKNQMVSYILIAAVNHRLRLRFGILRMLGSLWSFETAPWGNGLIVTIKPNDN